MRTCIACRAEKPKRELVRVVKFGEEIKLDLTGKANGRGAYVCNDLLYSLLSHFDGSGRRAAFIHIPYSTEQGKQPSMELEDIVRGLIAAIECI